MMGIRTMIDPEGSVTYYSLQDFSALVGLKCHTRVGQNPNAPGSVKRAGDLKCLTGDRRQPKALYIDNLRMRWLCLNAKCQNKNIADHIHRECFRLRRGDAITDQEDIKTEAGTSFQEFPLLRTALCLQSKPPRNVNKISSLVKQMTTICGELDDVLRSSRGMEVLSIFSDVGNDRIGYVSFEQPATMLCATLVAKICTPNAHKLWYQSVTGVRQRIGVETDGKMFRLRTMGEVGDVFRRICDQVHNYTLMTSAGRSYLRELWTELSVDSVDEAVALCYIDSIDVFIQIVNKYNI